MTLTGRTLGMTAALILALQIGSWAAPPKAPKAPSAAQAQLAALERSAGGRLGVAALDTGSGASLVYRAQERFPFCSTFKVVLVSAVLKRSATTPGLLDRRIRYSKDDLVTWSPITERHVADGQTVSQLCAAALQHSDNTAGNLLIQLLGGTAAVTAYARSLGDPDFRLDRMETALNEGTPGDPRDTTTPDAMARSLKAVALGQALEPSTRRLLTDWMLGNTTGGARIRAGVPAGWKVADKTGTGDYGTTNDIGVVWPPDRPPVVLAIYFTQPDKDAQARQDVVAAATRLALAAIAPARPAPSLRP